MEVRRNLFAMAVLGLLALCGPAWAVEVLEPGYVVEMHTTYSKPGIGHPWAMVFDSDENLYLTHTSDDSIWRIAPGGTASIFSTGIMGLRGIEWGGGTNYGDYLFGTLSYEIIRIYSNGTTSHFADFSPPRHAPHSIRIDRTGNYGGKLFTGTGGQDHTYKVDTDGSVMMFSNFPGWTDGGGPYDIDFDLGTEYGGLMYMATDFGPAHSDVSGIFSLDPSGNPSRFTNDLVSAFYVTFDRMGDFGAHMFAVSKAGFDADLAIWRVAPDGTATEFARTTVSCPYGLAFGLDGAMYVAEYDDDTETVIVSRIGPGEPPMLESLEITGPEEVAENFTASYKAIAHYDNNSTRDVTDSALWSVEPDTAASIDDYGVLTTEDIITDTSATIWASYTEGEVTVDADKAIHIFPICPTGTALQFDGANDYVVGSSSPFDFEDATFTVSAWFKTGGYQFIIVCEGAYKGGWSLCDGGDAGLGKIKVILKSSGSTNTAYYAITPNTYNDNKWHHVAAVITTSTTDPSGNAADVFMDGSLVSVSEVKSYSYGASTDNWRIGARPNIPLYFNGKIEDVRIYNRALSAEEIQANMHTRLQGDEPGLVGYWDFDEGAGQIAYDLSGNGNNGTLGSTPNVDNSDPAWVESDAPIGVCGLAIAVDIKPGSCPNPLNVKSRGVLPAAILGSEDFDVNGIDAVSIRLAGVGPIRHSYEDVATPVADGNECDCTTEGPDGYTDLTLKFKTQEIVNALGDVNDGDVLALAVTGVLYDETPIEGEDCILVRGKRKSLGGADINKDTIVDMVDFALIAEKWLQSSYVQD